MDGDARDPSLANLRPAATGRGRLRPEDVCESVCIRNGTHLAGAQIYAKLELSERANCGFFDLVHWAWCDKPFCREHRFEINYPMILPMPNQAKNAGPSDIQHTGVVVFVGANGTGKSRLGAWLEKEYRPPKKSAIGITRIAAQRTLTFPAEVPRVTALQADRELHQGGPNQNSGTRMQGDPVLSQMNDYDALMRSLFAHYAASQSAYYKAAKAVAPKAAPSEDILDQLTRVWQKILPHRPLDIDVDNQAVMTTLAGGNRFSGQQMSDGERVALYLTMPMASMLGEDRYSQAYQTISGL